MEVKSMKILVYSDIHSSEKAVDLLRSDTDRYSPDLLLLLGDITHFGPASFAEEFISSITVRTLAIPGNCDTPDVLKLLEEKGISLHGKIENIGGLGFVGFGGSNITPFDTITEFSEDDIFDALDAVMVKGAVLVTHVPPRGHVDGTSGGLHVGSTAVARIVEKYRPRLSLSGHVHEARGMVEDGGILFMNPGAVRKGYRAFVSISESAVDAKLLD
jgi:Icc-related predicted phosphoesterase